MLQPYSPQPERVSVHELSPVQTNTLLDKSIWPAVNTFWEGNDFLAEAEPGGPEINVSTIIPKIHNSDLTRQSDLTRISLKAWSFFDVDNAEPNEEPEQLCAAELTIEIKSPDLMVPLLALAFEEAPEAMHHRLRTLCGKLRAWHVKSFYFENSLEEPVVVEEGPELQKRNGKIVWSPSFPDQNGARRDNNSRTENMKLDDTLRPVSTDALTNADVIAIRGAFFNLGALVHLYDLRSN